MNSNLFIRLQTRRAELESLFLNFPTSDSLLPHNQDKIKAYILAFHSELESYVEDVADGVKAKLTEQAISKSDFSLLPSEMFVFPQKIPEFVRETDLNMRGARIIKDYEQLILKRNNGIKEKDVLALFLPLGLSHTEIGASLLNSLSSYGEKRCTYAHLGKHKHPLRILDRDAEQRETTTIESMLKDFDDNIMRRYAPIAI